MTSNISPNAIRRTRLERVSNFLFRVFFTFLLRYRRTSLGPLWTLVAPALFVGTLGLLFAGVGNHELHVFIPHIAVGYVAWSLIQHLIVGGASVYKRGRANIMQGQLPLDDLVLIDVMESVLIFLHQSLVVVAVFLFFKLGLTFYSLVSLAGIALIVANGVWVIRVVGLLGARYRDFTEVLPAVMRIFMLMTPIIWMPSQHSGRSALFSAFLSFNPFYHFIELVRAPLLGNPIAPLSWIVVISITVIGFMVEAFMTARYARYVPLWV